jgi:hypothetical protein
VQYDLDVTSKTPANVLHLFDAASAFLPAKPNQAEEDLHQNIFGITDANIAYVPSDVTATAYYSEAAGQVKPLGDAAVFDNEGTYYWDVSVAVPISKISQAQFNNSNNTVTSSQTDKRNVFTVLDLYPFKKDVKNSGFDWHPYALAGVGVASQPLHRILVAAGWGPRFAQFYAGVIFAKQEALQSLAPGSPATPAQTAADVKMRYKAQFSFGINLTVRDVFKNLGSASKTPGGNSKAASANEDKAFK